MPTAQPTADRNQDGAILESLGLALMAVDRRCRIIRFNEPAEKLTGYRSREVLGSLCSEVLKASRCTTGCPLQAALHTGTTCRFATVVVQTSVGWPLTLEVTASSLLDAKGAISGAVGILRDAGEDRGLVRLYGGHEFVSYTPAMRRVFEALPRLASSQAPLLIVGGRGSGRSALAEIIHHLGAGSSGLPLIRVNPAGANAEARLLQSLAQAESCSSATLLLEELCSWPDSLQQRLLAWLEDAQEPRGVRLLSTASYRLEVCRQQGRLRPDFFYRLNVLHVVMPSLRERSEDIPLLVQQFIEDLNLKRRREVEGVSPAAMARLLAAEFPDNVRQLRMVVDQAHRQCPGRLIEVEDLPELSVPLPQRQRQFEAAALLQALDRAGGNLSQAAQLLGIHRTTLWRRLKRLGLEVDR